jgi:polyphosphate kinase
LFETALKRRRRGSVIRIEFDSEMPEALRDFVASELGVSPKRVRHRRLLAVNQISEIVSVAARRSEVQALQSALPRAHPRTWRRLLRRDPREGHVVHHPYESFDVVVQFLRQAARDPEVVAIKQTLYRTSTTARSCAR